MQNFILWIVLILFVFFAVSVPILAFRKGDWKRILLLLFLFGAAAALLIRAAANL